MKFWTDDCGDMTEDMLLRGAARMQNMKTLCKKQPLVITVTHHSAQIIYLPCIIYKLCIKIHNTIILTTVTYWCEHLYHTLRRAHRFWVQENKMLKRICGFKTGKITGRWRRLNEELHNCTLHQLLHSSEWGRCTYYRRDTMKICRNINTFITILMWE